MAYTTRDGRPATAEEALIPGTKVLRDGYHMSFDLSLMDGRPNPAALFHDGKTADPPKTIDEALRATFASQAKSEGITVQELLAEMSQAKIEEIASQVAARFMSAAAGAGIAKMFGDATTSAGFLTAALAMRADAARQIAEHRLSTAYLGDAAPTFAAAAAMAADADVARAVYLSRQAIERDRIQAARRR